MPFVQLRRQAPEVQSSTAACAICGSPHPNQVQDHMLVGTPGVPSQDGVVCEHCGQVLERVVDKLGPQLSVQVEHAQREATERDTPAAARTRPRRAKRG